VNGSYIAQYRLAGGAAGWADLRGWYVELGVAGEPDALVWTSKTGVNRAILEAVTVGPGESGSPAGSGAPSPGASR
jgi:hypothetical protein